MSQRGFSLTRIFSYILLIREYTGQRKPVFWHVLRSEYWKELKEMRTLSRDGLSNKMKKRMILIPFNYFHGPFFTKSFGLASPYKIFPSLKNTARNEVFH